MNWHPWKIALPNLQDAQMLEKGSSDNTLVWVQWLEGWVVMMEMAVSPGCVGWMVFESGGHVVFGFSYSMWCLPKLCLCPLHMVVGNSLVRVSIHSNICCCFIWFKNFWYTWFKIGLVIDSLMDGIFSGIDIWCQYVHMHSWLIGNRELHVLEVLMSCVLIRIVSFHLKGIEDI